MSERELLIREIAQTPDTLVTELLNFLLFIKARKNQDNFENPNSDNSDLPSFLNFIDRVNSETPVEENAKLPRELSKNLDSYLYGSPKQATKLYLEECPLLESRLLKEVGTLATLTNCSSYPQIVD